MKPLVAIVSRTGDSVRILRVIGTLLKRVLSMTRILRTIEVTELCSGTPDPFKMGIKGWKILTAANHDFMDSIFLCATPDFEITEYAVGTEPVNTISHVSLGLAGANTKLTFPTQQSYSCEVLALSSVCVPRGS